MGANNLKGHGCTGALGDGGGVQDEDLGGPLTEGAEGVLQFGDHTVGNDSGRF